MALKSLMARVSQPAIARSAYLVLWVILVAWSYCKANITVSQVWGKFFWLIDYSNGFIKRGLAGTVFHSFGLTLDNFSWIELETFIVAFHGVATVLIVVLLIKIQYDLFLKPSSLIHQPNTLLLCSCWLVFACTQFWSTLAYNTGFVDIYLLLAYIYCFYLFDKQSYLPAAIIGSLMMLLHEGFLHLWISIVAAFTLVPFIRTRHINRRALILSLLPILVLVLTLLFHNQAAATAEINSIPDEVIDQGSKKFLIQYSLGQTLLLSLRTTLVVWHDYIGEAILSLIYYTWPSFLTMVSIPLMLKNIKITSRTIAAVLLVSSLPLSITLVAVDLSRFLVWFNLTTILFLTYFATAELRREFSGDLQ